jgi:hypothetical protein
MKHEVRLLRGYKKAGDNLEIEIDLKGVDLEKLQKIFNIPQDDPMYNCYPVGQKEKKMLQPYAAALIEIEKYDFFLECHAEISTQ